MDENNFDDFILMLESRQARYLNTMDDRAEAELNRSIQKALKSMAE